MPKVPIYSSADIGKESDLVDISDIPANMPIVNAYTGKIIGYGPNAIPEMGTKFEHIKCKSGKLHGGKVLISESTGKRIVEIHRQTAGDYNVSGNSTRVNQYQEEQRRYRNQQALAREAQAGTFSMESNYNAHDFSTFFNQNIASQYGPQYNIPVIGCPRPGSAYNQRSYSTYEPPQRQQQSASKCPGCGEPRPYHSMDCDSTHLTSW